MSIKIVLLKSGEQIISDVYEVSTEEDKIVGYSLARPCTIHMQRLSSDDLITANEPTPFDISLYPWVPLSKNESIMINKEHVIGFVDAIDQLEEMYQTKILDLLKEEKND